MPRHLATLGLLLVVAVLAASAPASGQSGVRRVGEAPDFATEMLADPWDYDQASDIVLDGNGPTLSVTGAQVAGGRLRFTSNDAGYVSPHLMAVPGALASETEGQARPIDASRYTHAAMSIYVSERVPAGLQWFSCEEYSNRCLGMRGVFLEQGWQTVTFPITSTFPELAGRWQGNTLGLRLAVSPGQGRSVQVEVEWLRLYRPTEIVQIDGLQGWDRDRDRGNNTSDSTAWGSLPGAFDLAAYPPGIYNLYGASGDLQTIEIAAAPIPVFLDPDVTGGVDWATQVRGDAWDFSQASDVAGISNARDITSANGVLQATNSNDNPFVQLAMNGAAIDGAAFNRVTVASSYDGPFNLSFDPGGGSHARLVWQRADTGSSQTSSRELLTYTSVPRATWVLGSDATETGGAPWAGPVNALRWDPNEDPGARRWLLDDIRVAADDRAAETFDVRWNDPRHRPGTEVSFFLDPDRQGFDGPGVGTATQVGGDNVWRWRSVDALPGRWWPWARGTVDGVSGQAYASGPVVVDPRIAGADRIATAIALSRSSFERSDAAIVASASNFADALAAASLADAAGAPVLLNSTDALHPAVRAELQRLGAGVVYLAGGPSAQRAAVEQALTGTVADVVRVSGENRYATAAQIARHAVAIWAGGPVGARSPEPTDAANVVLALGSNFPDALAAGPLVAAMDAPLLLVPGGGMIPAAITDALDDFAPEGQPGSTLNAVVLGGPKAIAQDVADRLGADGRIAGPNRYATAVAAADAAAREGADAGSIVVASGADFADALAAGPVVAVRGGVLLLTPPSALAADTAAALTARRGDLRWLRVAGGPAAVSSPIVDQILDAVALPR